MEIQDSLFSTVLDGVLATTDEAKAFEGAQVLRSKTCRLGVGVEQSSVGAVLVLVVCCLLSLLSVCCLEP